MSPFEKAGYTKETNFKVLRDWGSFNKGDIVTLELDDGSLAPLFKTRYGDKFTDYMYLPNMAPEGFDEQLEVYEELNKELTPFEEQGYTKDTKFRVLVDYRGLYRGDIVTLAENDGTICPRFETKGGNKVMGYMYLPNAAAPQGFKEELEVYEEAENNTTIYTKKVTVYRASLSGVPFDVIKVSKCGDKYGCVRDIKTGKTFNTYGYNSLKKVGMTELEIKIKDFKSL